MSSTSEPTPKPRRHQSLFVSGMCSLEMFWGRVPEASIPLVWRPQSCHAHTFTMHLVSVTGLHCFIFLRVVSIANFPDLHSYRRTAVRVAEGVGFVDEREPFKWHKGCAACDRFGLFARGQCPMLVKQALLAPIHSRAVSIGVTA